MTSDSDQQAILDDIADDFMARTRRGEMPRIEEYQQRYPEIAHLIARSLETIQYIGKLNASDEDPSGTRPGRPEADLVTLSDYKIVRKVGEGGMGIVYEAEQRSLGRRVALKVLSRRLAHDQKFIERFKREARAAAKLHHSNIVPVFDVGHEDSLLYYTMQFIDGQSLDHVLQDVKKLEQEGQPTTSDLISQMLSGSQSVAKSGASASSGRRHTYMTSIARLGASVAEALAYAHERSILHRDVKLANLILDTKGVVWLVDFGLARTSDSELTETGDFLGTALYMSPERIKGQGDQRGDIYSLGVSLYELATGERPFQAVDRLQLIDQIANCDPRRPSQIKKGIPIDLETIILKAMDKDPRRRYQSAAEMANDLRRFVDDQPIHARRASIIERGGRWVRQHKAQTVAMISMAIAIAALVIGTRLTVQQRNLARANETRAIRETERADAAATRAKRSAEVTVEALTALVESVQTEMRSYPELVGLKQKILANAQDKLNQITQIADDSSQIIALKIRAFSALGQLTYEIGRYDEGQNNFLAALELATQLQLDSAYQTDVYRSKSNIYRGLGAMAFERHDQDDSRRYYQLAYDNNHAWRAAEPQGLEASMELARSLDDLADTWVLLDDRDWDQAQAFHQQALDIRRQALESRPGSFQLEYDYAASHMKIGDMHYGRAIGSDLSADQAIDQMQLAKDWFLKGTALCAALVEAYPAEELQGVRQLAAFYERVADTCEGVEAHEHYMSSIQLKEQMAPKLAMDRNFQRDRAISWGRAARRLNENGAPEIARKHMRQCLDILQQLSQRIPDDTGLRIDEMMTWYQMGELLPPTSNQRQEAWQNALKIGNELIQSGHIKADFILFRQIKDMVEHQLEPIGESR